MSESRGARANHSRVVHSIRRAETWRRRKGVEPSGDLTAAHAVLKPELGHHRLSKLQPLHIQAAYSKASESGGRKDKKEGGLSAQTVLHHHRVLHDALRQAVRWQLLARNPADAVEPPRASRKELSVLDEDQTATLLEKISGTWIFMPSVLAIATGMRRGEILAVRWEDIDLETGVVRARRSLQQVKGGLSFKDTKGRKGRAIKLPTLAVDLLRKHRAEQAKQRLLFGPAYQDQDLVCARMHGTPISPNELTGAFAAVIRDSDLPRIRFHDLRHYAESRIMPTRRVTAVWVAPALLSKSA